MTVPTILFLPLVLWPICWMIVQVVRSDNARPSPFEKMRDHWSEPTWTTETRREPTDEESA